MFFEWGTVATTNRIYTLFFLLPRRKRFHAFISRVSLPHRIRAFKCLSTVVVAIVSSTTRHLLPSSSPFVLLVFPVFMFFTRLARHGLNKWQQQQQQLLLLLRLTNNDRKADIPGDVLSANRIVDRWFRLSIFPSAANEQGVDENDHIEVRLQLALVAPLLPVRAPRHTLFTQQSRAYARARTRRRSSLLIYRRSKYTHTRKRAVNYDTWAQQTCTQASTHTRRASVQEPHGSRHIQASRQPVPNQLPNFAAAT